MQIGPEHMEHSLALPADSIFIRHANVELGRPREAVGCFILTTLRKVHVAC